MKKRLFPSLFLLIFSPIFGLNAQNSKVEKKIEYALTKADTAFVLKNYKISIDAYKYVLSLDDHNYHALYYLAESYRHLYKYNQALGYYQKVSEEAFNQYPLSLFYLGKIIKLKGKYHRSIEVFEKFIDASMSIDLEITDEHLEFIHWAFVEIEGSYWAIEQMANYDFYNLIDPINSNYNDFAPVLYNTDSILIITSGRIKNEAEELNILDETNTKNYVYYKDYASWEETNLYENFIEIGQTEYNTGSGCFIKNGTEYYFTICGKDKAYCQIYKSILENDRWSEPQLLSQTINAKNADTKDPALTPGGDTIFFSSKREGGLGGYDIYYSIKDENGQWGEPLNIGIKLNTGFNEVSPFYYAPKDMLFFSSDGRKGFGGYDVFMSPCKGFNEITNIAPPLNSSLDDLYFVMDKHNGYLASNRNYGQGKYDIYTFMNIFSKISTSEAEAHIAKIYDKIKTMVNYLPDEKTKVYSNKFNNHNVNDLAAKNYKIDYFAVEKVLSEKIANKLYEIGEKLVYNDYQLFVNFNPKEQRLLDNLYQLRADRLNKTIKEEFYAEDAVLYQDIAPRDRQLVDNIANNYIDLPGQNYIRLNNSDSVYYESQTILKKNKIDRLIAYQIAQKQKEHKPVDFTVFNFHLNTNNNLTVPKVSGTFKTKKNSKIPENMKVILLDEKNKKIKQTTTSKNGEFNFTNLAPNKQYLIVAQQVEYQYLTTNRLYLEHLEVTYDTVTAKITKIMNTENTVDTLKNTETVATTKIQNNTIIQQTVQYGMPLAVYFEFNKYSLSDEAKITLDRIILKYRENNTIKITLQAFTDSKGSQTYNLALSQKRGKAAYNYLTNHGIKADKIEIKAMGAANPIATNTTEQGRRLNRRVEFIISQTN